MAKSMFRVIAVQDRFVRVSGGSKIKADEGYVAHQSFQVAESAEDAIEAVKAYHMPTGTKYDSIRAEFVRPA